MNDATTIRNFVKGLKNAHSLATCIYEKGPQILTDNTWEVEKLNAANSSSQQWSSHPPQLMWCSTKRIAVSSIKNQDISQDIALTLGAMNVKNMVTLSWTVHTEYLSSGTPATHHKSHKSPCQIASLRHHREDRDRWSWSIFTVPLSKTLQLESLQFK